MSVGYDPFFIHIKKRRFVKQWEYLPSKSMVTYFAHSLFHDSNRVVGSPSHFNVTNLILAILLFQ